MKWTKTTTTRNMLIVHLSRSTRDSSYKVLARREYSRCRRLMRIFQNQFASIKTGLYMPNHYAILATPYRQKRSAWQHESHTGNYNSCKKTSHYSTIPHWWTNLRKGKTKNFTPNSWSRKAYSNKKHYSQNLCLSHSDFANHNNKYNHN